MLRGMERVRIRTPQSLLALLPRIAGPVEPDALVVVPLARGRSGTPMTLDLPEPATAAALAAAIRRGAPEADAVLLVASLAAPIGAGALPGAAGERALVAALEAERLGVLESLALAPDAWGDYARPASARGPRAELDLEDDPVPGAPLPPEIPGIPVGDDVAIARLDAALDALEPTAVAAAADDPVPAIEAGLAAAPLLASGGRSALGIDRAAGAALAVALVHRPALRDLAIVVAIDGPEAQAAGDAAGAARMLGEGPAPDHGRVLAQLKAWTALAAATPVEDRAPLLVIVGFLHFALGRGRTAARCAEQAAAIDPGLTMAPLLRDLVDARGAPTWLRERTARPARAEARAGDAA